MLFDHTSDIFFGFSWMNYVGRLSFPIFAFELSEGYLHTKNLKAYIKRLFLFALISQIPFMLFYDALGYSFKLNVLFTLLFGLFALFTYEHSPNKVLGILFVVGSAFLAELCQTDYGAFGVIIIFLFYFFKEHKLLLTITYALSCFLKYLPSLLTYSFHYRYLLLCLFTFVPILLLLLYNGKLGKKTKYLFYLVYPLHLLILSLFH